MHRRSAKLVVGFTLLLAGCWGSGTADSDTAKAEAFEEVIGLPPTASVSDLRSHYYYMRDSYVRWLRFTCEADMLKLIESRFESTSGWDPRWAPGFQDRNKNPNAPDWWWELDGIGRFEERVRTVSSDHTSDTARLWIDPGTGTVFATHNIID